MINIPSGEGRMPKALGSVTSEFFTEYDDSSLLGRVRQADLEVVKAAGELGQTMVESSVWGRQKPTIFSPFLCLVYKMPW